jgi:hypothetical protein
VSSRSALILGNMTGTASQIFGGNGRFLLKAGTTSLQAQIWNVVPQIPTEVDIGLYCRKLPLMATQLARVIVSAGARRRRHDSATLRAAESSGVVFVLVLAVSLAQR